jgi:hypothetical protein
MTNPLLVGAAAAFVVTVIAGAWSLRRRPSQIEPVLRASIGKEVVLGVVTVGGRAEFINQVSGRILAVEHGRVRIAITAPPSALERASPVGHAEDWGLRVSDVRWVRVDGLETRW